MSEFDITPNRSEPRRYLALLVITAATALALGHTLRQPTQMAANDISRWCTVWSLLERGSYVIDECPWQIDTQDKVFRAVKTPVGGREGEPAAGHYYSSKPALLPTLIAGILYPARLATGIPLDRVVLQERAERWTQKPDPDSPYKVKGVLETPKEPARWPVYVFYFKPILILLNVIPFGVFLILYARVLDRYALNDWAWFFCLVAASFGTYLLPFSQTLNNHTVAAYSAFFGVYQILRIWEGHALAGWRFALAGFCAAFAFTNELPALAFLVLVGGFLTLRHPRYSLAYFVPAALVPIAAFAAAQYAALGELKLQYESFGSDEYLYEGSLWKTPLELDAFNDHPESYATYFFHLTFGHHGIFSLTPIFLFSALGAVRLMWGRRWSSAELRRVDTGLALVVLVDPPMAAGPPGRRGTGRAAPPGSRTGASRAGLLGHVGRLRDPQSLEPYLDLGRTRAPQAISLEPVATRGAPNPAGQRFTPAKTANRKSFKISRIRLTRAARRA
jgi:hypothetical protein